MATEGGLSGHARQVFIGVVAALIAAGLIAYFNIGRVPDTGVTIEGPSTVVMSTTSSFKLTGHANGSPDRVYWTDTFGQEVPLGSPVFRDLFYCPALGEFTVTLTAVYSDGSRGQASHSITCV
ncbi:MAG TPA: hypothetical protein VJA46_04190 [Acidimicrobiia bacterium]|nr:hypothetical protein [Acidimicrobiia bacterium]